MNDSKNTLKIPYLSASRMEKLLELVSERSLINIEPSYFEKYGFSKADAYLAINTLKFLGLIDENDRSTDLLRKFQLKGEIRNKETQQILKDAYKDLFNTATEPYKLSKDDLTNEFMHHYGLSKRVAASAVPAFLKLCEFVGFLEQGSVLTRKRINKSDEKQPNVVKKPKNVNQKDDFMNIPIGDGNVGWWLPAEILTQVAFGGNVAEDIKSVTDKISEFKERYCKTENSLKETKEEKE